MKFLVCMENTSLGDFSADDLTIGRLHEVIGEVDTHQMLRIIDDSGEDYLYPAKLFGCGSFGPNKTAMRSKGKFLKDLSKRPPSGM